MSEQEIKQIEGAIKRLIVQNVEAGSSVEKAIDQAYNRMNMEYPKVLAAFLNAKA